MYFDYCCVYVDLVYSFTQALENRTMESRSEMQMIEKLEELKDLNARHASGKFFIQYLLSRQTFVIILSSDF